MNDNIKSPLKEIVDLFYLTKGYAGQGIKKTSLSKESDDSRESIKNSTLNKSTDNKAEKDLSM